MPRKRSPRGNKKDQLKLGAVIAGGIVLATLLRGGINAEVKTPSILFAPPDVIFPGFNFSLPGIPSAGTGITSVTNVTNPPSEGSSTPSPNAPTSQPSILDGLFSPNIPTAPAITTPSIQPERIPFDVIAGKALLGGYAFDFGRRGAFEFFSENRSPLEAAGVGTVSSAASSEVVVLGSAISKVGFNEGAAARSSLASGAGSIDDVARLGRASFLGALGGPIALAGAAYSGGQSVGAAEALQQNPSAGTAAGFGSTLGGFGFAAADAAAALGAPGFVSAPGLVAAGAGTIAFSGAGVLGALGGLGIDQFLTQNFPSARTSSGQPAESPVSLNALNRIRPPTGLFSLGNPFSGRGFQPTPTTTADTQGGRVSTQQSRDNGELLPASSVSDSSRRRRTTSPFDNATAAAGQNYTPAQNYTPISSGGYSGVGGYSGIGGFGGFQ